MKEKLERVIKKANIFTFCHMSNLYFCHICNTHIDTRTRDLAMKEGLVWGEGKATEI